MDDKKDQSVRYVEQKLKYGSWLRQLRDKMQFSQIFVAASAELSVRHYQDIEYGHRDVRISTFEKILNVYGLTLNAFFSFVDTKLPDNEFHYDEKNSFKTLNSNLTTSKVMNDIDENLIKIRQYCQTMSMLIDDQSSLVCQDIKSKTRLISDEVEKISLILKIFETEFKNSIILTFEE